RRGGVAVVAPGPGDPAAAGGGAWGLLAPGPRVRGPAVDEQPDGRPGPCGEVPGPRRQRVQAAVVRRRPGAGGEQPLAVEQPRQGERAEAHAGAAEELAPRGVMGGRRAEEMRDRHGNLVV